MPISPIRYRVAMPEPQSHEFEITVEIPATPGREAVDILFPAWAPGSYLVRDFSRHVYDLEVRDGSGKALFCERMDKSRWRLHGDGRPLVVHYRVFAFETSVRTSFLDDSHAFLSGTSLFFLVEGEAKRPCVLTLDLPAGWRASTALPSVRGKRGVFHARDFDELVDSPVEAGTHALLAFTLDRTRFEIALYGKTNVDRKRLLSVLRAIVRTTGAMFGGLPFRRYLFIIHALPARGGGLEHANSCTLDIPGLSFEDERGYQSFAELAAHEFFHVWNVKRIHDRVLGPFDYSKENYTRLLWFHEGFTEYMQGLVLLRAGLLTPERYLKDLAESWTRYQARPGRNGTPLSDLSYEAWIKQYKPADNHLNRAVSYYDKGRWVGLALDLVLRHETDGRRGLPDVFRRLWQRYGARDEGIDAAIVRREAEAIAGTSLGRFFRRFVDGTAEIPVPTLLRRTGVAVQEQSLAKYERNDQTKAKRLLGWSGLVFAPSAEKDAAVVKNVVPGSPAWRAGITFGDEIVAVDDARTNAATVTKRLADGSVGQALCVHLFRKDRLLEKRVRLGRNPERKWQFALDKNGVGKPKRLRTRWLGTP
jgi:predicted metalloprotease with PDZ domain